MLHGLNMPVQETVPQNTILKVLYFILSSGIQTAVDWTMSVYHGVSVMWRLHSTCFGNCKGPCLSWSVNRADTKKDMKTVPDHPHLNSSVKFKHWLDSDFKLYFIILASNNLRALALHTFTLMHNDNLYVVCFKAYFLHFYWQMVCMAGQKSTFFPFKLTAIGLLFYRFLLYRQCL